jgi:hypothetical protein
MHTTGWPFAHKLYRRGLLMYCVACLIAANTVLAPKRTQSASFQNEHRVQVVCARFVCFASDVLGKPSNGPHIYYISDVGPREITPVSRSQNEWKQRRRCSFGARLCINLVVHGL